MRSFFQKSKATLLIGSACCFCLVFLQGCITDPVIGPTPEAPIVLNFELQTPIIVSEAEVISMKRRFASTRCCQPRELKWMAM